ncbi:hypothetical protein, partial [Oleiphilus sp. HI0132]|uniref:hypothetical protein n=1 Tax=Oleiphilus sp. HI0132 TaxID=1822270 RepID=UPI001E5DE7FE
SSNSVDRDRLANPYGPGCPGLLAARFLWGYSLAKDETLCIRRAETNGMSVLRPETGRLHNFG